MRSEHDVSEVLWNIQMMISKNHYDLKFKEVKIGVRDLQTYSHVGGYSVFNKKSGSKNSRNPNL